MQIDIYSITNKRRSRKNRMQENFYILKVISFTLLYSLSMMDKAKSDCNYFQNVQEIGKSYYVFNPGYPNSYRGENHCSWQTQSPYVIKINCSIDIPQSDECTTDVIYVMSEQKPDNYSDTYCGSSTFNQEGMNIAIIFDSWANTTGGRFLCELHVEKCRCGWSNPTRIVGGEETGVNEYPMMAGLVDVVNRMVYSGATIISDKYVLTAAHCMENRNINNTGVVVGEHDVSTVKETDATVLYRIERIIKHEKYDRDNNDIAICKIEGTIVFSIKVGPVCLPFQHWCDSFGGSIVTELGWGLQQYGGAKSNTLQKVNLNVLNSDECKKHYPNITSNKICIYTPGKDSCQMDSGGPVLSHNPTTDRFILTGIISSGVGCASKIPGIAVKVGSYIKWIISVTPGEKYCKIE